MKYISMKSISLLLLIICIALPNAALTEEAPMLMKKQVENRELSIEGMAQVQGKLYILTRSILRGGGLYRFETGEKELEPLPVTRTDIGVTVLDGAGEIRRPYFDVLLSDGETLYAYNQPDGSLYIIHDEGSSAYYEPAVRLEADGAAADSVVTTGNLIVTLSENTSGNTLTAFNMTTGKGSALPVKNIQRIAAYKDNMIFMLVQDMAQSWDEAAQRAIAPTLALYDIEKNQMLYQEPLPEEMGFPFRIAYSREDDALYLLGVSLIYRMDAQGDFKACAYVVGNHLVMPTASILPLPGNLCAVATTAGIRIGSTDTASFETLKQVSLAGVDMFFPDALMIRAQINRPDIAVNVDYSRFDSQAAMITSLITRAGDVDVFMLNSNDLLTRRVLDKGYALDLQASPLLSDAVTRMHPALKALIAPEGTIQGLPYGLSITFPFACRPRLFEALGLAVPTSFYELCGLITKWNDAFAYEYSDYLPLPGNNYHAMLYRLGVDMYISHMDQSGEKLLFDTPLFRELMATIAAVRTDQLEAAYDPRQSQTALITLGFTYSLQTEKQIGETLKYQPEAAQLPLRLSISGGEPLRPEGSVQFLCVNAGGKQPDAAISFLEAVADGLELKERITLMPDELGPVPNVIYEEAMRDYDDTIASLKKQISEADAAQKRELEEKLHIFEMNAADYRDNYRYEIGPEPIAQFHQRLGELFITSGSYLRDAAEIDMLLDSLLEGRLNADNLIREADAKLNKIYSEMP